MFIFIPSSPVLVPLLMVVIMTGRVINGFSCYHCNGRDSCKRYWDEIAENKKPDSYFADYCAAHQKYCELQFSTQIPEEESDYGRMYLIRAGCTNLTTDLDLTILDDSGCFSTAGTHSTPGTRTCYCKDWLCNRKDLKCHACTSYVGDLGDDSHCLKSYTLGLNWATECVINWESDPDGRYYNFQGLVDFHHDEREPRPVSCNTLRVNNDWANHKKCTCSTPLCNETPVRLVEFLLTDTGEPTRTCIGCKVGAEKCRELKCPKSRMCSSHYTLIHGEFHYFLDELSCKSPTRGYGTKFIRNGCHPPYLSSSEKERSCYCDTGDLCNDPALECFTCKGPEGCRTPTKSKASCGEFVHYSEIVKNELESKSHECFISYDDTVWPPELEAGCRPYTLRMGIGSEYEDCNNFSPKQDWVGSKEKKSCRCETAGCNGDLRRLVASYDPEPELQIGHGGNGDEDDEDDTPKPNRYKIKRKSKGGISIFFKSAEWGLLMVSFELIFVFLEIVF